MSDRDSFRKLDGFLKALERAGIFYSLARNRDGHISVLIAVPGERWEVDFSKDSTVEVERFKSNGQIAGEEVLKDLFDRFTTS